ncbi:hypothetical protein IQ255_16775 [Pleurocapsales cyanobacterium LEGE 10410]|nr:hypothetical protein [Pleurocapsales cyanobacterium LEGE 10410]
MEGSTRSIKLEQKIFPAKVVTVISDTRIAINRGLEHKIRLNQRVLMYRLSNEEIKDPDTGESLGYLEIYKGTGKVISIQEKMSIIESDRYEIKTVKDTQTIFQGIPIGQPTYDYKDLLGFEDPEIGDLVKPI